MSTIRGLLKPKCQIKCQEILPLSCLRNLKLVETLPQLITRNIQILKSTVAENVIAIVFLKQPYLSYVVA
jgi:hypothetical protein